jgi:thiamine biosynthesis lipoprotein
LPRDEAAAQVAFAAAFQKIADLDGSMSDYNTQSELSRLSASSPHTKPVEVTHDLWQILYIARSVSRDSEGAFDVSVGPITRLWRQARREKKLPDAEKLQTALAAVGYKHIRLSEISKVQRPETVQLTKPHMRLDLGGIAQGFAADRALQVLQRHGITRAIVNASGDIVAGDPPPGERGWKVALGALDPTKPPTEFVMLANASISTSGDAFQYTEVDGVRYSHIVDPKTGIGLTTTDERHYLSSQWHARGCSRLGGVCFGCRERISVCRASTRLRSPVGDRHR